MKKKADELQQILYITTHDLRSPLVNIDGFTREMKASLDELNTLFTEEINQLRNSNKVKRILEEEIPEAVHFITSSTAKMDRLLTGLLALSRLGRQKLTFHKLNMNQLMNQVLENYQFHIENNNIQIEMEDLPDCTGDDLQINQLFSNLIGNSIKFLDNQKKGIIKIKGEKEKNGVVYSVEDNGIGISKEYQEKIFNIFEKLDPQKPGIGLGLNIVLQITDKHNGTLQLESDLGKGTKFIVFLPYK